MDDAYVYDAYRVLRVALGADGGVVARVVYYDSEGVEVGLDAAVVVDGIVDAR